jgi:hypothetical protein
MLMVNNFHSEDYLLQVFTLADSYIVCMSSDLVDTITLVQVRGLISAWTVRLGNVFAFQIILLSTFQRQPFLPLPPTI